MAEKWTVNFSNGDKLVVDNVDEIELLKSGKHIRLTGASLAHRAFVNLDQTDVAYSDHVDVVFTPAVP